MGRHSVIEADLERANACLVESLRLSAELDSIREMAVAIAALMLVAAAGGQGQRAARLAGSTQSLLDRAGCDLPAFLRGEYEKGVGALQARLGSAVFEDYVLAGRAMPGRNNPRGRSKPCRERHVTEARPRSGPGHVPRRCSAREWEIAHVARGARNRESAEALVLTERTVGSHLERIFGRLEIRNRAQLAAWVAERISADGREETAQAALIVEPTSKQSGQNSRQLRVIGE